MTADRQAPAPPRPTFGTLPASNLRTIPIPRLCSAGSPMGSRPRVPPSLVLLLLAPPLAAQARGPAAQVLSSHGASAHALPSPTVHAAARSGPITLDGRLDEA